jgi:hypothetical protein
VICFFSGEGDFDGASVVDSGRTELASGAVAFEKGLFKVSLAFVRMLKV